MGAGPSPQAISRAMRKCREKAKKWNTPFRTAEPRLIRASNGEAAIVFDVVYSGHLTGNKQETIGPYHTMYREILES